MIMSFWPTSLREEENKKNVARVDKTEQGERRRTGRGRETVSRAKQKKNKQDKGRLLIRLLSLTEEEGAKAATSAPDGIRGQWGWARGFTLCCHLLFSMHNATFCLNFFVRHRI